MFVTNDRVRIANVICGVINMCLTHKRGCVYICGILVVTQIDGVGGAGVVVGEVTLHVFL